MSEFVATYQLQKELSLRGLLPPECRLVEVSMSPHSVLLLRYEVFITNDQLSAFADALKAAADAEAGRV